VTEVLVQTATAQVTINNDSEVRCFFLEQSSDQWKIVRDEVLATY